MTACLPNSHRSGCSCCVLAKISIRAEDRECSHARNRRQADRTELRRIADTLMEISDQITASATPCAVTPADLSDNHDYVLALHTDSPRAPSPSDGASREPGSHPLQPAPGSVRSFPRSAFPASCARVRVVRALPARAWHWSSSGRGCEAKGADRLPNPTAALSNKPSPPRGVTIFHRRLLQLHIPLARDRPCL